MSDLIVSTLTQGLIYALLSYGVYITYSVLDFPDLTVDSSFPLGAAVTAILLLGGVDPWLTLLCAAGAGALAGLCTGLIDLSPGRLSPAGLRHGKVEPAVLGLLPVLGRDNMGQRIGKVMDHPFGLSRCPGGKVHNHRVGGQGGEPVQGVLGLLHGPGEVREAGDILLNRPQLTRAARLGHGAGYPRRHLVLGGADDGLDRRAAQPVEDILLGEHVGHGNQDRADQFGNKDNN